MLNDLTNYFSSINIQDFTSYLPTQNDLAQIPSYVTEKVNALGPDRAILGYQIFQAILPSLENRFPRLYALTNKVRIVFTMADLGVTLWSGAQLVMALDRKYSILSRVNAFKGQHPFALAAITTTTLLAWVSVSIFATFNKPRSSVEPTLGEKRTYSLPVYFGSFAQWLHLHRIIFNAATAALSPQNRWFFALNTILQGYSLYTLSLRKWIETEVTLFSEPGHPKKTHIKSLENMGDHKITKVTLSFYNILLPIRGTPQTLCSSCDQEKPDVYLCGASHPIHEKCLPNIVSKQVDSLLQDISFKKVKSIMGDDFRIQIPKGHLLSCSVQGCFKGFLTGIDQIKFRILGNRKDGYNNYFGQKLELT